MVNLKKLMIGAVAAAAGIVCHTASAGPLTIGLDLATTASGVAPTLFVCADGSPCDLSPDPNEVTIIFGVGGTPAIPGYSGQLTTSFSNNPGTGTFNILDVTWSLSALNNAGGPLVIEVSQTGFNVGPVGPGAILESVCGGDVTPGSSATCQEWVNLSNTLWGLGPVTPGAQGPFGAPFSNTAFSAPYVGVVPYSITDRLIFNLAGNGTSTGDLRSITPVKIPEPATLLLIGAALAGAGFARRRKQA